MSFKKKSFSQTKEVRNINKYIIPTIFPTTNKKQTQKNIKDEQKSTENKGRKEKKIAHLTVIFRPSEICFLFLSTIYTINSSNKNTKSVKKGDKVLTLKEEKKKSRKWKKINSVVGTVNNCTTLMNRL